MQKNSTLIFLVDNQSEHEVFLFDPYQPISASLKLELNSILSEPPKFVLDNLFNYIKKSDKAVKNMS